MENYPKYWNEKAETLSPDEFNDTQEKAFLKQMDYVWANSEFYQKKWKEAGLSRQDIKCLQDIEKLPLTEKIELRNSQLEKPPLGTHMACAMTDVNRVYSTSGTTGRPTFIGVTKNDIEVWCEVASRALWTGGFRSNTIAPLVVSPFFIAASYMDAIENVGTVVPIGVGATDRLIASFQHIGANAILATSSFPLHFAASLRRKGIDPKSLGVKVILAGGEPGASIPSVRQEVEETYGCNFLEMMGNGDMCGQIWAECEHRRGMHFIAQGAVHPEIIDPETLEVLDPKVGTRGELVYTSLNRECIPLMRFRTRDHIEVTQTECECGRTGYGIRVLGRTDDMINVQGVNVFPAAVRDTVAGLAPRTTGAIEIQIHEPPPVGWKPPIHIKIEHGDVQNPGTLKTELEALIREKLLFRANVEMVPADSLPKYEYKVKLVKKLYEE